MLASCEAIPVSYIPNWVPDEVRHYMAHIENGHSIRSLARSAGCHASTVMRQVRRCEQRREDLLIDLAFERMRNVVSRYAKVAPCDQNGVMNMTANALNTLPDDAALSKEAPRLLRRLNEPAACLAIAKEMQKAVVVRENKNGEAIRTASVDRSIAEALAVKDWIALDASGRVKRYRITANGRLALKRFLAEAEDKRRQEERASAPFAEQHRELSDGPGRIRYNGAESPLLTLSRRKDKNGKPFLSPDLVAAGERLREDFELAQIGPRVTQNWDRFLTAGVGPESCSPRGGSGSSDSARDRVSRALADLGPGLGDVVLRCCCYLEGMEAVERRMGWSARSGKIVFRIALTRLKRHYDDTSGRWSPLIG